MDRESNRKRKSDPFELWTEKLKKIFKPLVKPIVKYKWEAPNGANPVITACYWKGVLDDHIEDVLGCSVYTLKQDCQRAVSSVRACADRLDKVAKGNGKAKVVGSTACIVGSALSLGGVLAAPFTGGVSLTMTLGGAGVATTGGAVNTISSLDDHHTEKSETENAKKATKKVVESLSQLDELLTICVHSFQEAQRYIKTSDGEEFVRKLRSTVSYNFTFKKSYDKDIAKDLGFLVNNVRSLGMVAYRTLGVVEFISSGTYASAGLQTALAIQASSPGIAVNGTYLVMVGSTGATLLSVGAGVLGIGMGVWEGITAADTIDNGSKLARKMRKFASDLANTMDELLDIYNKLYAANALCATNASSVGTV